MENTEQVKASEDSTWKRMEEGKVREIKGRKCRRGKVHEF